VSTVTRLMQYSIELRELEVDRIRGESFKKNEHNVSADIYLL